MVMMAGCATTQKGLTPKTNGTTCASGNANVCYKQARRYHFGKDVTNDESKAIQYYERACALDHADGCFWAARGYEQTDDPKLKNVPRARVLYQRLCKHDIHKGCRELGNSYIDYPQHPKEVQKGVLLLDDLCDAHPAACYELGRRYYFTSNLKADNATAQKYYARGCKLNNGLSCHALAQQFTPAQLGGIKNTYQLANKGCTLGNKYACVKKYAMQFYGQGTKKREKEGFKGLAKLCKSGWLPGCLEAITPTAEGTSFFPPNPKLAFEVLSGLCHKYSHPRSCALTGAWFDHERYGTTFDLKKVLFYYQKACKRRSPFACINLGLMYKNGRGVKQDHAEAFTRFKTACSRSVGYGCYHMALLYQAGLGVKKDTARAKKIITHQCNNKLNVACETLARWQFQGINGPKNIGEAKARLKRICEDKHHSYCHTYGVVLRDTGDKTGAIKAFEKECNKDNASWSVDSCIELVKLGQAQYEGRANKLKAAMCRKHNKKYCPSPQTKANP